MNIDIAQLTEQDGVLLTHEEEHYLTAWLVLTEVNQWLEIDYRSCNYPSLYVTVVTMTPEKLVAHIHKEFGGGSWIANKLNGVDGVRVTANNRIIGDEDLEDA